MRVKPLQGLYLFCQRGFHAQRLPLVFFLPSFLLLMFTVLEGRGQTTVTIGGGATITCPTTPTATWTTPPAGISFSNWSRGSGVTCATASNGLSGSGFGPLASVATASAAFTANKFYSFTISANATTNFTLNSIVWGTALSGTGSTCNFEVRYSNNGGPLTSLGSVGTSPTSNTFSGSVNVTAGTSIVIYLIPYGATASGTTVRVLNGSTVNLTALPTYSLTYNGNNFNSGTVPSPASFSSGTLVTVASNSGNLVRTGYTFAGWNTAADGSGTSYVAGTDTFRITSNTILYAQWTPNNNTITFDPNGGTGTMANQTIATAATANLIPNAFTRTGFSFSGWNTAADGSGTSYADNASYTMGTSNVTLYAQWASTTAPLCPSFTKATPVATQTICQGITAGQLTATITNAGNIGTPTLSYQWYYNAGNSNTISGATLAAGANSSAFTPPSTGNEGTRYYFCVGYAKDNGCNQDSLTQSLATAAVQITVNARPSPPTGSAAQVFCSGTNPTLGRLQATGTSIKWYSASTGGTSLDTSTALSLGTANYFATQTVSNCESSAPRLQVSVTVNATPAAPTVSSPQVFCNAGSNIIDSLKATGTAIKWYDSSTNALVSGATALISGRKYFATQTSNSCESPRSSMVTATILSSLSYGSVAVASSLNNLVISQVYGGGGAASGNTYTNDFIEIFNPTSSAVSLAGWSIQYASSTSASSTISSGAIFNLSGSVGPGKYFLVQGSAGGATTLSLPTPDAISTLALAADRGKVFLVNSTTALSLNATGCPTSFASVIDFVGYGLSNCFEGAGTAPAISAASANFRKNNGCTDGNDNGQDFAAATPNPRNSSSPSNFCTGGNAQTVCRGLPPQKMFVGGAAGSGSFTYQWYYKDGSATAPVGNNTTGWTSLGSLNGANTSVYAPDSVPGTQRTFAAFVTPGGNPNCGTGSGAWASGVIVVTVISTPETPVFDLATTTGNSPTPCLGASVRYSVDPVAGAGSYTWTVPAGWTITAGNNTDTITVTVGNTAGTVSVRANNACGNSPINSLSVNPFSITAPVATAATDTGSNGFTLNWNPVSNATGYYYSLSYLIPDSTIARWTFPTNGTVVTPDLSTSNNSSRNLTTNGGTIIDAGGATTRAPSCTSWASGANTKYWQIIVNTTGFSNLKLSSKQISSNTGPRDFKLQFSLNGTAFTDIILLAPIVGNSNWNTASILNNLVLPSSCDNQPLVYIRWTMASNTAVDGATVASGSSRIDDIIIKGSLKTGVPGYQNIFTTNSSEDIGGLTPNTTYFYVVTAESGCGITGNSNEITVVTLPPCIPVATVKSFSPSSGPAGTVVTIKGTGFTGAGSVRFGRALALDVVVVNDSIITATTPANTPTDKISVRVGTCDAFSSSVFNALSQSGCGNLAVASDLFISEVFDAESGSLSYIEIFNSTGAAVNLTGVYSIRVFNNGGTTPTIINLSGSIDHGGLFMLKIKQTGDASTVSCSSAEAVVRQTASTGVVNGNDEVYLYKNSTPIDYIPNPDYPGASSSAIAGFSQIRRPSAVAPSPTYDANDWITSSNESCSDLGTPPYSVSSSSVVINTQPVDVSCGNLTFSVAASFNPASAGDYLWKYFNPVSGLWENASGLTNATAGIVASNTSTATMSITGNVAPLRDYQFYCQITKNSCVSASNAAQFTYESRNFYRPKSSGNWSDPSIWEMSNTNTFSTVVNACAYPVKENSSAVIIDRDFTLVQDIDVDIDYLEIRDGTLNTTANAQLTISDSTVGPDFVVQDTWIYGSNSANSLSFNPASATWNLGPAASMIKTNNGSSTVLQNQFDGGINSIPASALWVLRYDGSSPNVTFNGVGAVYPTLIFESTAGLWTPASAFSGSTGFTTVKGNLDIGGSGTGTVDSVVYSNSNSTPMQILGSLIVRAGSKLSNSGTAAGTGFEVKGNVTINGILNVNARDTGLLILSGSSDQIFSGTGTVRLRNLSIANLNTNALPTPPRAFINRDISLSGTLTLADGGWLNLNTGNISLLSNAFSTARVAPINTGQITYGTGRFIVERHIPAGRKWQLLATPTTDLPTPQTIKDAWQEGNVPRFNTLPGYGTWITTNSTTDISEAEGNGFDAISQGGTSMKIYNPVSASYDPVLNTNNTPLANSNGYFIYVRGDRSATPSNAAVNNTSTILRSKGRLFTGNQNISIPATSAGSFVSIGNPFASSIRFDSISRPGGVSNAFYVWDPRLDSYYGLGNFSVCTFSAGVGDFIVTPYSNTAPGNYPSTNKFIQSGQAFFVQNNTGAAGTLSLREGAKDTSVRLVFRPSSNRIPEFLRVNLLSAVPGGTLSLVSGCLIDFSSLNNNALDGEDMRCISGPGSSISIDQQGTRLMVERRKSPNLGDTIKLSIGALRPRTYQLEVDAGDWVINRMDAFLWDKYLSVATQIQYSQINLFPFNIDSKPGSYAADRFCIIFKKSKGQQKIIPVTTAEGETDSEFSIFPNPVQGDRHINIKLPANTTNAACDIAISDVSGLVLIRKKVQPSSNTLWLSLPKQWAAGRYFLSLEFTRKKRWTGSFTLL